MCNLPQYLGRQWECLPKLMMRGAQYPWSQEKGSKSMNTTKISILENGVMTIMRTYKFIDIYANVPLLVDVG